MSDPLHPGEPGASAPGSPEPPEDVAPSGPIGRVEATVRGRVQGVGFRWFVSRVASRLELSGWVTNRRDGSVLLVAEGPEEALESLLALVRRGPAGAEVEQVDVKRGQATGTLQGFGIRSGSHPGD